MPDIVKEVDATRAERSGGALRPPVAAEILQLVAIQIRAFGPRLGVIKGVLVRKLRVPRLYGAPK